MKNVYRPSVEAVLIQLRCAENESALRVHGKLHWLPEDEHRTHDEIHAKQGMDVMDASGILPDFKGTLVYDPRTPYFGYGLSHHALCNAHHLRELRYIENESRAGLGNGHGRVTIDIKKVTDEVRQEADNLSQMTEFEQRYDIIVNRGGKSPFSAGNKGTVKKKGRHKQTPLLNLLDRLRDFKLAI